MMELDQLVGWLREYLEMENAEDFPGAHNGLQIANEGVVTKVAAAVDASESAILGAVGAGCDFLLVHHGLFWGGVAPITGAWRRKLKAALDGNLAVFSAHLPLDCHPEVGNNKVLAARIGMPRPIPFLEMFGKPCGLASDWTVGRSDLLGLVEKAVGCKPHLCPGGPETTRKVAVVTGAAGTEVAAVAAAGVDTFITGEGPHWSFVLAGELGVNLVYAGHYATETFGVRALAEKIRRQFGIPWEFLDHPSGL